MLCVCVCVSELDASCTSTVCMYDGLRYRDMYRGERMMNEKGGLSAGGRGRS